MTVRNSRLQNIEDIAVGDFVRSQSDQVSPQATACEYRRVVQLIETQPDAIYYVSYRTTGGHAETLGTTSTHPFYVLERAAFVAAAELEIGDTLALAGGDTALITEVRRKEVDPNHPVTTYNLTVAHHHTYFVGKAGVWVHNSGDDCIKAAGEIAQNINKYRGNPEQLQGFIHRVVIDLGDNAKRKRNLKKDYDHVLKQLHENNYIDEKQLDYLKKNPPHAPNRTLHTGARTIDAVTTSKQAESIYSWIRGLDSAANVKAVARNTGLPEWYVAKIRQHVFFEKHLLPSIDDPTKLVLRNLEYLKFVLAQLGLLETCFLTF